MQSGFANRAYLICLTGVLFLMCLAWGIEARLNASATSLLSKRFPHCTIQRISVPLGKDLRKKIRQEARVSFVASRYVYFRIECGKTGKESWLAVRDRHRVRTRSETVLILIDSSRRVQEVLVLDFHEPQDYLAPRRWLRLFQGKSDQHALAPGSDLAAISGATLTSHAVSSAVRRALALAKWAASKQ